MKKNIQWVNQISNLLLEDSTGETYRLLMMSIIDTIKENCNIQDNKQLEALMYAENYWFFYEGNLQELENYLNKNIEISKRINTISNKRKDIKANIINGIYRIILRRFNFAEIDIVCDRLYWLVDCLPTLGIKTSNLKLIFDRYFYELI